jgi:hypothetical protein
MVQQLKPCTSELTQLIPNKKRPRFHGTLKLVAHRLGQTFV